MRLGHFETLRPRCPVCIAAERDESLLQLASTARRDGDVVIEGSLQCESPECRREYPIVDGLPIIVADIRSYLKEQSFAICYRDDWSSETESMVGDCLGPESPMATLRQQLSSYTWDHYGDLDPAEPAAGESGAQPGAIKRLLEQSLSLAGPVGSGPILDLGCSLGRTTFELAERTGELVLGVDLHYAMMRVAAGVLSGGTVRYPRRRVGLVYDRREFPVDLPARERVDFWICDAGALPLASDSVQLTTALNLLDCIHTPYSLLTEMSRVLAPGGKLLLCSPYDWSVGATPLEHWLGGHSQRGEFGGAAEPMVRGLLTPGTFAHSLPNVRLLNESNLPWHVRIHERGVMHYVAHVLAAERVAG